MSKIKGAIFLDRDGVINRAVVKNNKPFAPIKMKQFHFYKNIEKYIKKLKVYFYIFVITNQPDISTGKQSEKNLNLINKKISKIYNIDEICVCTHTKYDKCKCRKPKNYFFTYIKKKYHFELKKSYFIGDMYVDYEFAKKSNINFYLIQKSYNKELQLKSKKNKFKSTKEALKDIIRKHNLL